MPWLGKGASPSHSWQRQTAGSMASLLSRCYVVFLGFVQIWALRAVEIKYCIVNIIRFYKPGDMESYCGFSLCEVIIPITEDCTLKGIVTHLADTIDLTYKKWLKINHGSLWGKSMKLSKVIKFRFMNRLCMILFKTNYRELDRVSLCLLPTAKINH